MAHPIRHVPRLSTTAARASDEEYSADLLDALGTALWRRYNDKVVHAFVGRHLEANPTAMLLKTDVFEEALGNDGIRRAIPNFFVGIDRSRAVAEAARRRIPDVPLIRADVRRLPFADAVLGGAISTSTLDHFRDPRDLVLALRELGRVLRPGAKLILTLDNPRNPLLAVRNAIPDVLRRRLGMTPYFVGYTCGPGRLGRLLTESGFAVRETTAILHFPRVLAALSGSMLRRLGIEDDILALLPRAEALGRWPTRWCTGHYIGVWTTRRGCDS